MADTILEYMSTKRPAIAAALREIADGRGAALESGIAGGRDLMSRLLELCLQGKMIRGCLVFLGRDIAEGAAGAEAAARAPTDDASLARLASAMELFQTGLLVHDDIMDRDTLRRGMPTIHASYSTELEREGVAESGRIGEALGICAGDACYFEAFALLARALAGNPRGGEIQALCAEILSEVVVAQMADVRWGASGDEPSEDEILAMYRCKTARYSFSLPLAAGALWAAGTGTSVGEETAGGAAGPGHAADLASSLMALGERLGILFQLRDDELGLFGDESATGKSLGSDLREGKKTLFRARLLAVAPPSELPALHALFSGKAEARVEDLAYIRRLSEELGVGRSIGELSRRAEEEAHTILASLPALSPRTRSALESLIDYVTRRER